MVHILRTTHNDLFNDTAGMQFNADFAPLVNMFFEEIFKTPCC